MRSPRSASPAVVSINFGQPTTIKVALPPALQLAMPAHGVRILVVAN